MIAFQIAGGVALILFGIRFLRKGLDRLFGGRLVAWMARMTERRVKAFGAGITVGALAPSSTALSLITLQMMRTGQLPAQRMLAVLCGAKVGMTVMVQLLALPVADLAAFLLMAGVVGFQFLHRERLRGVGQCLLALGFVFLAMQMIGQGAAGLSDAPGSRDVIRLLAGHPLVAFIVVTLATVAMQSSTASVGLAIALSAGGLFDPALVAPWVLGANFGVSLTALIAGWSTLDGRRLATASLLVRGMVLAPLLVWAGVGGGDLIATFGGSLPGKLAAFHTGFNLLSGLLALPLLGPVTRLSALMVVPREPAMGLPAVTTYLDPQALESPSLALANATRETLVMADGVKSMLRYFWKGYSTRDLQLMERVRQEDDHVDASYRGIKDYLSRIGGDMNAEETRWQFALLTFSNELESVGDLIEKSLCDLLRKQAADGTFLPDPDYLALDELQGRVLARFEVAQSLLANHGGGPVREFRAGKETLNDWCRQIQRAHYERLRRGEGTLAASAYFLDLLEGFRRINSHLSAIGYAIASSSGRRRAAVKADLKSGGSPVSAALG